MPAHETDRLHVYQSRAVGGWPRVARRERLPAGGHHRFNDLAALRGAGALFVLDARTGVLLRRLTVGVAPQAVAVDQRSGRVVVVNAGGVIRRPQSWLAAWTWQARAWLPWRGPSAAPAVSLTRVPGSVSVIDVPA